MSEAKETFVIILAKSALHRAAWEALLIQQPGIAVWGSAAELENIPPLQSPPHKIAVLVDFPTLPIDWLQKLGTAVPGQAILCLVDEYNLQQIVSLLQAGIGGCLLREAAVPDLIRALIAVSRGEIVLPPALAAEALAALARGSLSQDTTAESLTERENDVLHLLARGKTNKDIAQTLFLSVRTIEAHLHNIYSKLNVNSRTEAVLWAVHQQDIRGDI